MYNNILWWEPITCHEHTNWDLGRQRPGGLWTHQWPQKDAML